MVDFLDIVAVVQHGLHFFEFGQVVAGEGGGRLGDEGDFLDFEFKSGEGFEEGCFGFEEFGGGCEDGDGAVFGFDFFDGDVGGEHGFDDFFFVIAFEGEDGEVVKRHDDGAIGGEFGVVFVEAGADVGDGAGGVVGEAIDDDEGAVGAEALVAHGLKVFTAGPGGFLDGFFDDVAGDVVAFGFFDEGAEGGVCVRVRHTVFGGHVELSAVFGKELGFLGRGFEDGGFAFFEDASHGRAALSVE